jgi:hypothetical protein
MASGGIRVVGLKETLRDLAKLGLDVDDFKESFGSIASTGAALAASFVRSKSGALAGTLRGNRAKNRSVVTAGRASKPYAGVQNYGWPARGIEAQEFMQRADKQLAPTLPGLLETELSDKIKRRGLAP